MNALIARPAAMMQAAIAILSASELITNDAGGDSETTDESTGMLIGKQLSACFVGYGREPW